MYGDARWRFPFRPSYKVCPGDRTEVEVVRPDGSSAFALRRGVGIEVASADRSLASAAPWCDRQLNRAPSAISWS